MSEAKKHLQIHQMTIRQFDEQFPTEDHCRAYLHKNRWPAGVKCPRCGNDKVNELKTMPWKWECSVCAQGNSYRFSVLVGTIFENTNKPLTDWFRVMHIMLTRKKGISALQIYRVMGFGSYNTALLMCNKIRFALGNAEFKHLVGYVEVDETYIGGKGENKHGGKGPGGSGIGGRGTKGKAIVAGAVQRKGNVVARGVASANTATLDWFVRQAVSTKVSLISSDEWSAYRYLKRDYPHGVVLHGKAQYVAGAVYTNTIEGFWSIVKRGIIGTFHKVSKKHLQLYINEFEFRYNNRKNRDIFGAAIRAC